MGLYSTSMPGECQDLVFAQCLSNPVKPCTCIVVCKSLVQFSGFSEFGGENTQISLKFGANRANT